MLYTGSCLNFHDIGKLAEDSKWRRLNFDVEPQRYDYC